ncbi:alpha/beta hydrolase family protein [Gillisia mitskevichiae]|uniref:Alpha/beta hydrolase family protein n=1 Tax=Gillisia mitskevichiae TaxID=270921 RepID=A0A495PVU3_9FLAO|nr:alpha/beta fold hydrolase [Gillisia mitskevichiae]RKS55315.1 alpha/beta hydrolase family protein [Gillisia mitskevichiae]
MELIKKNNIQITGKHNKPILTDLVFSEETKPKPVVIFCHGYKGFKDWGAWDLMAKQFAENGIFFLKFNFSHNGTTPDNPTEFLDIEAFGDNNYTKELDDLQSVIDWLFLPNSKYASYLDISNITLIGHSRGGGISIIKAAEEKRISKLVTFSAVSDFASRFPSGDTLDKWKQKGVNYIVNTRTKQQLPHHFQFYKNFKENEERLTISRAAKALKIPHLIVHGSKDTSVPLSESGKLFKWSPYPELLLVEGADHVYDLSHPWDSSKSLPANFKYVLEGTSNFIAEEELGFLKN